MDALPTTKPLDLVKLTPLMSIISGRGEVVIGLIDGPVAQEHSDLASAIIRYVPGRSKTI